MEEPLRSLLEPLRQDEGGDGPKYRRLADGLAKLIDAGELRTGDKLPNEIELAAYTGLSLGTVQKALRILSERGVLCRRHGHGTFVTASDRDQQDLWYFRFLNNATGDLLPVTARAIDRRVIRKHGPWHDFLKTDDVIRIRRLLDVDGRFRALSDFYLELDRFRAILDVPISDLNVVVLRGLLNRRFHAPTFHASQCVWCDRLPDPVCRLLKLPANSFGLLSDIFSRTHRDVPISMHRIHVPPGVSAIEIRG